MKEGRAMILILRSIKKRGLQESTSERIGQHLLNIARSEPQEGQATEKRAEELIYFIEDESHTEEDVISYLEKLEKTTPIRRKNATHYPKAKKKQ